MKKPVFIIVLLICSLFVSAQSKLKFLYKGDLVTMGAEYVMNRLDTFNLSNLPDPKPKSKERIKNVTPLTERFWRLSLSVLEANMVKSEGGTIFATDLSSLGFCGVMGANTVFPKQMKQSLFKSLDSYLSGEIEEHKPEDISWIWAAGDLFSINNKDADWQWLFDKANEAFKQYYNKQFDSNDGLYRGIMSYLPMQNKEKNKSLAINCLYLKALETIEMAADSLKLEKEKLRLAINKEFRNSDSTYASIKYADGTLCKTTDVLGSSLALLFNVVNDNSSVAVLHDYPVNDFGVPLFSSAVEGLTTNDIGIIRPLGVSIYCKAIEKVQSKDLTAYNMAVLVRGSKKVDKLADIGITESGNTDNISQRDYFFEFIHAASGISDGEPRNILSAVSFIDVCIRANLLTKKTE